MKRYSLVTSLLIVTALSFLTIIPLFHPGWFPMHDDAQVQRVYEMGKSLHDGLFPVRWVSDLGYGYGYSIFNFYAPLAYYIGAVFSFIAQSALIGTKLMIGFGMLLSGATMFFLGRRLWGDMGGIVSAVFYVFAPYHSLDVYVRGDMAESVAYAFIPLIFLGLFECYKNRPVYGIVIGSIGYALVMSSHNLTALMITPFVIITIVFLLFVSREPGKSLSYVGIIVLGLLLSCWYWLPVFAEMHFTNVLSQVGGGADFHDHFVCLGQLWNSPWGYGGSVPGCTDGLSFRIGKLHVIFSLLAIFSSLIWYRKDKTRSAIIVLSTLFTACAVILLLPVSKQVWELIHPMAFFQYPWRFLLVISFFMSLLIGSLPTFIPEKNNKVKYMLCGIMIACMFILYYKLFAPQSFLTRETAFFETKENLAFVTSQISDEYLPPYFQKPKTITSLPTEKIIIANSLGVISTVSARTGDLQAQVRLPTPMPVDFNIAYFPAWHLTSDGLEVPLHETKTGMSAVIQNGTHVLQLRFRQTIIEVVANLISLVCAILMLCAIIKIRYGRHKKTS